MYNSLRIFHRIDAGSLLRWNRLWKNRCRRYIQGLEGTDFRRIDAGDTLRVRRNRLESNGSFHGNESAPQQS